MDWTNITFMTRSLHYFHFQCIILDRANQSNALQERVPCIIFIFSSRQQYGHRLKLEKKWYFQLTHQTKHLNDLNIVKGHIINTCIYPVQATQKQRNHVHVWKFQEVKMTNVHLHVYLHHKIWVVIYNQKTAINLGE